jgi:hypothetical protein
MCDECFMEYVRMESISENDTLVNLREGRISCPECNELFADQVIPEHCSGEIITLYMKTRMRIQTIQTLQTIQQESIRQITEDRMLCYTNLLRDGKRCAKQCANCGFGPVIGSIYLHNLNYLHNIEGINNACPRCRNYVSNFTQWDSWDGIIREEQIPIQIYIILPNTKSIMLTVDKFTLVENIKLQIQTQEGILSGSQHLIFSNKTLNDRNTLYDYNICENSTIHMMLYYI